MRTHPPSSALDQLHTQAQAEASRLFGDGPVAAWDAAAAPRRRRAWRAGAAALLVAIAALASLGSMAEHPTPARVPAATDAAPEPDADPPPAFADAVPGTVAVAPPGAGPRLAIGRTQGLWTIDAVHASRLEAARRLAQLSGTPLPQSEALLADAAPLELQWQGRDLAAAWQAVIGPELNFALHCRRQQCRVWLLGRNAAATPSALGRDVDDDVPESPPPPPGPDDDTPAPAPATPPPVDELHHG